MLNLLAVLQKDRFNPRFYIAAATDNMSLQKAELLENSLAAEVLFLSVSRSAFCINELCCSYAKKYCAFVLCVCLGVYTC